MIQNFNRMEPASPDPIIKKQTVGQKYNQASVPRFAHINELVDWLNDNVLPVVNGLSIDGYQGLIDASDICPIGEKNWYWRVDTGGQIPGGQLVQSGDQLICTTDSPIAGTWNLYGSNFMVVERNTINNLIAETDPLVTDDVSAGYTIGSMWYNTLNHNFYIVNDVTLGTAVWNLVGAFNWTPDGEQQDLIGPGAFSLVCFSENWTSTLTGDALTLADGVNIGQLKKIKYVAEAASGDTGILALTGYTSITFNTIGDYVLLKWIGTSWKAIEYSGVTIAP